VDYDLLRSTTTTYSKIRGFTIDLLSHLRNRELRTADLVDLTAKYSQYINRYLYNMRNYGLVEKNGFFWKLTDLGLSFLTHLESLGYINLQIRKNKERIKKESRKNKESYQPTKPKQLSISPFLKESNLSQVEVVVVDHLVDHYNKTGSKFIFIQSHYDLAEKLNVNPTSLKQAITNLKQDRICWLYRDRTYGRWKLGLYKAFIETLKKLHM